MNDAATALECKDYTRTKDEIKKGELMMAERQKHISLADKGVVQSNLFNVQYQAVDQIHSVANSSLIHDETIRPQIKGEYSSTEKVHTIPESPTVRARLKQFIPFWREINASKFVLDIIESGYKIPFIQTTTSYYANNNVSARNHFELVNEAVNELLGQLCIEEITD